MNHFEYVPPAIFCLLGLIYFAWLTFFTSRALDFQTQNPYFKTLANYFVVLPPKKNRFHFWVTRLGGFLGMILFGFGFFAMLIELF